MKTITKFIYFGFASLALACFTLSPTVRAVVPTPDGGYPNRNTAEGTAALLDLTGGDFNTALGNFTLALNTVGDGNTAVGSSALRNNTTGSDNTAVGENALNRNQGGFLNTAVGVKALFAHTTGDNNTALGWHSLRSDRTGEDNTAIGAEALDGNTTGSRNIALGVQAGFDVITADHVIAIGSAGADVSNTTWIGNVYGVTTQNAMTAPAVVSADGQFGTVASSERFKRDIATMENASEAILSLRPVTFHYKTDTKGVPQFGLIAEEVAKVNPALVLPDKEGKPYTVRYDAVNAMLLNEFLKGHQTVQELKKQVAELTAGLQKVSAQLETSKPAPQVAENNQ